MRTREQYYLVIISNQLFHQFVDGRHRNVRSHLLYKHIFEFDTRNRFFIEEIVHIFIDIVTTFCFFTFVIRRLHSLHIVSTRAFIFSFSESETTCTFCFFQNSFHRQVYTVNLAVCSKAECFFSLGKEILSISCTGTGKRRIGCLAEFVQTAIQHIDSHVEYVLCSIIRDRIFQRIRRCILFEEDVDRRIGNFFVSADIDQRFLIVCYRIVNTFGRVYRSFYVFEYLYQLGFHFFGVDVTDDNDSLQIGTVPFSIVITDILIREVVDNVNTADRHTVGIFRIRIHSSLCISHDA